MAGKFQAAVSRHAGKYKRRMAAVVRMAVSDTIGDMQLPVAQGGRHPVDTGFHRNSLVTRVGATQVGGAGGYVPALANYTLGDAVLAGYTANYSAFIEYGSAGRRGYGFREGAARKWPFFVAKAAARARTIS